MKRWILCKVTIQSSEIREIEKKEFEQAMGKK
jgi:hypothetical protein